MNTLFDWENDRSQEAPLSAREVAQLEHRRAQDRERQRRCRSRKKAAQNAPAVTEAPEDVTLPDSVTEGLFAVTVEPGAVPPIARPDDPIEVRAVLAALGRAARGNERVERRTILRHLKDIAAENGWQIFDAARFLDGAFDSGLLPHEVPETCEVSRGILDILIERGQL